MLAAPFPWFGGKSRVAGLVWERFGEVPNYVEPFAGSLAVLLGRPLPVGGTETVNDKDGFIANFWRALQHDPEEVTEWADHPVFECDQHARHVWLVQRREYLTAQLEGDPDYYDAKIAGWWVWGLCCWIGGGWCSGKGPWQSVDGQRVHLGNTGQGVHRKRVHLGNTGQGVHRKLVHIGNNGQGEATGLYAYMLGLAERLRYVRVCCGDWSRICGPTPTVKLGLTGVFLDPPYSLEANRDAAVYAVDDLGIAHDVREWAIQHGDDPGVRIALCGYAGEHTMPEGWTEVAWKATGGYGSQGDGQGRENAGRERVWFSPHCLQPSRAVQGVLSLANDPEPDAAVR